MSNHEEGCYVCEKHEGLTQVPGGPVYQDELFFVSHAWNPSKGAAPYLGAFIVEPKRHVRGWAELSDIEAGQIGKVVRDLSRALEEGEDAEHIYVFVIGHHVPHLHVWVVPRYPDTPRKYWGMELFEWPERPKGTLTDIEDLCSRVRAIL